MFIDLNERELDLILWAVRKCFPRIIPILQGRPDIEGKDLEAKLSSIRELKENYVGKE